MKLEGFPQYVKDYHEKVASQYDRTAVGNSVAWEAVKHRLDTVDGQVVANEESFKENQLFKFKLDAQECEAVYNEDEGTVTLDAVLASTEPRKTDGKFFSTKDLQVLAEKINEFGLAAPGLDHDEFLSMAVSNGFNADKVREQLAESRGFLDDVQAAVEDGKLWIQAKLDETYKTIVDNFESVSIESIANPKPNGRLANPDPVGFIFTNNPRVPNTDIAD